MKHKVCELEGALLDAAVAMAEGYEETADMVTIGNAAAGFGKTVMFRSVHGKIGVVGPGASNLTSEWAPSRFWHQTGPLIEREQIGLTYIPTNDRGDEAFWCASILRNPATELTKLFEGFHASPLVAAMRAYVTAKLGDEIDLTAGEAKEG